jgi:hypothetical protein
VRAGLLWLGAGCRAGPERHCLDGVRCCACLRRPCNCRDRVRGERWPSSLFAIAVPSARPVLSRPPPPATVELSRPRPIVAVIMIFLPRVFRRFGGRSGSASWLTYWRRLPLSGAAGSRAGPVRLGVPSSTPSPASLTAVVAYGIASSRSRDVDDFYATGCQPDHDRSPLRPFGA